MLAAVDLLSGISAPGLPMIGGAMSPSLCESCGRMREVISGRGSRFLLCELSRVDLRFAKYPGQPVLECPGHIDRASREER